ncbi:MAG: START domain-containing protein [Salibacteraceae bacterium]
MVAQDWQLKKNENGIKVFTKAIEGSEFDAFKAEMEIDLSVSQIENFLRNMDQYPEAFPDTKQLKILARPNDSTQIQYAYTDAPWPVSDRDGVYQLVFRKSAVSGQLKTSATALPDYVPRKDDVVRIEWSKTYWIATPVSKTRSKLEYIVNTDPGGSIPEWVTNGAAIEVPYRTFVNIRKELVK